MFKRMLAAAMLTATLIGTCFMTATFAQDQGGQMMKSENKMVDTMMKDDKMMKEHKKSKRKSKKHKSHQNASMKSNKM